METNKFYHYSKGHSVESEFSRLKRLTETNVPELYCFLAVSLLMPRMRKLDLKEYWSKDWLLSTPAFPAITTRDRYMLILRLLHFSDNSAPKDSDRLKKIRLIVDSVRSAFRNRLYPHQNVCIDGGLLLFKGKLMFKQYIPTKRNFVVYTGETTDIKEQGYELGKSGYIVGTLIKPYLEKGHTLFVDNWHSSPALFLWMHNKATNACVTVKKIGSICLKWRRS
ncbi:hypothetical protein J437_LFUL018486 [Ladona fulva]|uniref:PiggyBac transposable element-derived protein domain-containing protein n=1 Tax=Ladona fulva TaxID=123851 RepID=A0A8K0K0Z2_LADFU|nr:hypothetical protein J437_LFUL018486 [Ladona fulva]